MRMEKSKIYKRYPRIILHVSLFSLDRMEGREERDAPH